MPAWCIQYTAHHCQLTLHKVNSRVLFCTANINRKLYKHTQCITKCWLATQAIYWASGKQCAPNVSEHSSCWTLANRTLAQCTIMHPVSWHSKCIGLNTSCWTLANHTLAQCTIMHPVRWHSKCIMLPPCPTDLSNKYSVEQYLFYSLHISIFL